MYRTRPLLRRMFGSAGVLQLGAPTHDTTVFWDTTSCRSSTHSRSLTAPSSHLLLRAVDLRHHHGGRQRAHGALARRVLALHTRRRGRSQSIHRHHVDAVACNYHLVPRRESRQYTVCPPTRSHAPRALPPSLLLLARCPHAVRREDRVR
jgi:hypothetical protein